MELSKRLGMNASLVPLGASVADIGCDHGYVSIYLARERKCRVIAMDVREGPLAIAKQNIKESGMADEIQCRLSDGLERLSPGEVDTLLIAGMGGTLICGILQKEPVVLKKIKTLVLQPQSDLTLVRKCLYRLGFYIEKERYCVDAGKHYIAILACRENGSAEKVPYSEAEFRYGRDLIQKKDAGYRSYLLQEREKYRQIKEKLAARHSDACQARMDEILHILHLLEEILW